MTTDALASYLYTNYCSDVGGKAFNGDPLPDWDTFSSDPAKTTQAQAWRNVAINAWATVANAVSASPAAGEGRSFGDAIASAANGFAFRLASWQPDVFISLQKPDEHSKMTAPYLYVTSRFGRVPWIPTMIEILSKAWVIIAHPEAGKSYVFRGPVAALPPDQIPARTEGSLQKVSSVDRGADSGDTVAPGSLVTDAEQDARARVIAVNWLKKTDEERAEAENVMAAHNPDMLARVKQQMDLLKRDPA